MIHIPCYAGLTDTEIPKMTWLPLQAMESKSQGATVLAQRRLAQAR